LRQFEDGLGAYANRDFKEGEIVVQWNLKVLSQNDYKKLSAYEQDNFCHIRNSIIHLYPDPERHVNRSITPNVVPDFRKQANIALRDIQAGEELSILDNFIKNL
jgi:hypothetical protein